MNRSLRAVKQAERLYKQGLVPNLPEELDLLSEVTLSFFNPYKNTPGKYRTHVPTRAQFLFAAEYLKNADAEAAYKVAGYANIDHYKPSFRAFYYYSKLQQYGIQALLRIATTKWCKRQEINADRMCAMVLDTYEKSTNMRDRLAALRLLADFSGIRMPKRSSSKK